MRRSIRTTLGLAAAVALLAMPGLAFPRTAAAYDYHPDARGSACGTCHGAPSGTDWIGRGPHSHYADDTSRCSMCHVWGEKAADPDPLRDSQVCYKCHGASGPASAPIGSAGPNVLAGFFGCVGQAFDPLVSTRHPAQAPGEASGLLCTECHDPHADPAASPKLLRWSDPATGETRRASAGAPADAFCWTCHGSSANTGVEALVPGYWERTGDKRTEFGNIRHGTMSTSSATRCGSCHAGHGSSGGSLILSTIGGLPAFGTPNSVCLGCHTVSSDDGYAGGATYQASEHGRGSVVAKSYTTASDLTTGTHSNTVVSPGGWLGIAPVDIGQGASHVTSPAAASGGALLTNGNLTDYALWQAWDFPYLPWMTGTATVEVVVDLGTPRVVSGATVISPTGMFAADRAAVYTGTEGAWVSRGATGTVGILRPSITVEFEPEPTRYVRLVIQKWCDDWDRYYLMVNEVRVLSPGDRGSWTSPVHDASREVTATGSSLSWSGTQPAGSSIWTDTRFSADGGAVWSSWTSATAGTIPQVSAGTSLRNARLQYRIGLERGTATDSPAVDDLTSTIPFRETSVALGTWPGTGFLRYQCANCHDPHGTVNQKGLRASGNQLCLTCHDAPSVVRPADYSYRGSGTYATSGHGTQVCASCHSVHGTPSGGGAVPRLLASKDTEVTCYGCHADPAKSAHGTSVKTAFEAGSSYLAHHSVGTTEQVSQGTALECADCHNVHSSSGTTPVVDAASRFTRPFSRTTYSAVHTSKTNVYLAKDTDIDEALPVGNAGRATTIDVNGTPGARSRTLLYYDLSGLPAGSLVASASLHVWAYSVATATVSVKRIDRNWYEGVQSAWPPPQQTSGQVGATWNCWKWHDDVLWTGDVGLGDWQARGGDLGTEVASIRIPNTGGSWVETVIDVADFTRGLGSQANFGLALCTDDPVNLSFVARETAVMAQRPFVYVEYAPYGTAPTKDYVSYCLGCHSGASPSTGVKLGTIRSIAGYTNDKSGYAWHGARYNPGSVSKTMYGGGGLKAPYRYDMPAMQCSDCHDSHGTSNVYHLKSVVNGVAVAPMQASGRDAESFCGACHGLPGHGLSQTGMWAGWDDCFGCHKHGIDL